MFGDMNSGYSGYSMSNNAVDAYEDGEMPLSKWTKADIIGAIESDIEEIEEEIGKKIDLAKLKKVNLYTLKNRCLYNSSWHHTGPLCNPTFFYSLDTSGLKELIEDGYKSEERPKKDNSFDEGYCHGKYNECVEFHPYSQHRKAKYEWQEFENGRTRGNWLYLENGKRKKLDNVKIEKRTKTKRRKKK